MSALIDQVTTYARDNPGVVACACVTVLLIAVSQIVLTTSPSKRSSILSSEEYRQFPLISKREVSHNTRVFRFGLPTETDVLGLPLGRHISLRAMIDGNEVRRPYTPISSGDTEGYFELLVKVYPSPNGLMSRHLDSMNIGDTIGVRGPLGKYTYNRNDYRRLFMVCGGTGITPMWQVFRAILEDDRDETEVSLVFANVTDDDILLREELDQLQRSHSKFSVFYVLNNPPPGWSGGVGFVTEQILEKQFGKAATDSKVLMCGPPPMNKAMKTILTGLGYTDTQVFKF